jgi:peptide/nickel transport system substrate-binding protein
VLQYTQPWQFLANEAPGRPGADPAVRKALFLTLSREDYAQAAFDGLATPSASLLMPGMECYDPSIAALAPKQNLDAAKSTLLAAGYTLGTNGKFEKNGKPLKIEVLGSATQGNGPDYLLAQFQSLGIDASVKKLDHATFITNTRAGNFDVAVSNTGNTTPLAAVQTIYGNPPPTGNNFASIKDPTIEKEMPLALQTVGTDRCQYWSDVQKALIQGNHWYGLAAPQNYWFSKGVAATPVTIIANAVDYTTLKWK